MNDVEPKISRVRRLKWTDMHSGEFSWGASLLLKLAFLGLGVCFVYWTGWSQPSHSPGLLLDNPGVHQSHMLLLSDSAVHPDEVMGGSPLSGKDVVQTLTVLVDEPGQTRKAETFTVDLNDGTLTELEHLPGIGPVLAGRIVAHRTSHGAFRQIEDLALVPGIGAKRLEQLRPLVGVRASTRVIAIGG